MTALSSEETICGSILDNVRNNDPAQDLMVLGESSLVGVNLGLSHSSQIPRSIVARPVKGTTVYSDELRSEVQSRM